MNKIALELKKDNHKKWLAKIHKYAAECFNTEKQYIKIIEESQTQETSAYRDSLIKAANNVSNSSFIWWLNNSPDTENFRIAKQKVFKDSMNLNSLKLSEFLNIFMLEFALARAIRYFANITLINYQTVITKERNEEIHTTAKHLKSLINGTFVFESNTEQYIFNDLLKKLVANKSKNITVKKRDRGNALRRMLTIAIISELVRTTLRNATPTFLADISVLIVDIFFDTTDRRQEATSLAKAIITYLAKEEALQRQTIGQFIIQTTSQINLGE